MKLAARIEGVGLVGPALAGWSAAREALAGRVPYERVPTVVTAADALPATERRRAGKCVRRLAREDGARGSPARKARTHEAHAHDPAREAHARAKTRLQFEPPKPNELVSACVKLASRPLIA